MNMKSTILTLIILIIGILGSITHAQESFDLRNNTKHHEICIGVADLFSKTQPVYTYPWYLMDLSLPYYPYMYEYYEAVPKISLRYKYNFGKIAIRAGGDFSYKSQSYHSDNSDLKNETTQQYGNYKIGAEYHTNFKRIQLIYGIDLCYTNATILTEYESQYWNAENDDYDIIVDKNKTIGTEYGICPFIGVRYFLNENLSLGVETNYTITKYKNENNYTYNYEGYKTWNDGINSRFGSVGILSLNVHF